MELDGPTGSLFVSDLKSGARTRLSFGEGVWFVAWSPDGRRVAYSAPETGSEHTNIYVKRADGAGEREVLLSSGDINHPTDWTRDGRYLIFNRGPASSQRVWVMPLFGDRKPFALFPNATFDHFGGRVSPDGKWIAYVSMESGVGEIYVTSFPGGKGKWQISPNGASATPSWGADGKELYFVSNEDGTMDAASVQKSAGSITVAGLRPLFRSPFLSSTVNILFDVDPKGGQRFIGSVAPETDSLPLSIVTHWTEELKKK